MEQYKEYPIIQVDGGAVMVEPLKIDLKNYPYIVVEKLTTGKYSLWQIDNSNDVDLENQFAIIARRGIESLKDSGLPLFDIPANDLEKEAMIVYKKYCEEKNISLHLLEFSTFFLGYRAAGGYTEEDIRNAVKLGLTLSTMSEHPFTSKEFQLIEKSTVDTFLKSLKKYPTSALVEVDYSGKCKEERCLVHPCDGKCLIPKVDKNNYLIIKEFKYE